MSYDQPNYTQTPNAFYDEVMPQITSLAELKVTLAIMRQTFGFHKTEDELSLSRLQALTGLSRQSVEDGIKKALARGYVTRRKHGQTYLYRLKVNGQESSPQSSQESRPPKNLGSQESRPEVVKNLDHQLVKNLDPQKKGTKEKKESSSSEDTLSVETLPDDTTARCLWLLQKVKGFPRNQAENALYLAELRSEFPGVDATNVVRQYELWHRDNPGKTRNFRGRLRSFFEKAAKDQGSYQRNGSSARPRKRVIQ